MTIRIEREDEMRFTGTFERRACDRTVRPTVDAQGRVRGFALPDGTATLTFDKPPLTTRSQVSSTVECPEELTAAVFTGQIHRESLRLENRFRVTCLAPSAAREVFEVVYLVEGTRN